jgi:hypothetical protein
MNGSKTLTIPLASALLCGLALAWADEPAKPPALKPAEPGTLVVLDSAGKEQKIKAWKWTEGTTHLAWLAAPAKDKDDKDGKPGPEALVLRAQTKINFLDGVLTYVLLDRLRALDFDNEKQTVTARVATAAKADADQLLTGSTRYKRVNKFTLEADVDKGEAGVASVTYLGGTARGGIRGVRFPPPKVAAAPAGRPAVVETADDDVKQTHKVTDLKALYRLGKGQEKLLPTLMFKKTLKVDLGKVQKIVAAGGEGRDTVWQVTQGEEESSLTLLPTMTIGDQTANLAGLVGRVPAGYVLIPVRRVVEIRFSDPEKPKEKDKDKEKKKEKEKEDE